MAPWKGIAIFANLLLLLAVAARAESGVAEREIRLGSCSPLSGSVKGLGTELLNGAQAYLNLVNEHGGIHGRKVKLLTYDDQYDPDRAILCFKQLTGADVLAGVFFAGAVTATKYVPMGDSIKLPLVGFSSGSEFITDPVKRYVFNARASFNELFAEIVEAAWKSGYRKFGIIYQDDAFGAAALRATNRALQIHGAALAAEGSFARDNPDPSAAVTAVRHADPEAVFVIGFGAPAARVIKEARRLGWKPQFLSVTQDPAFLEIGGKDLDGVIMDQVVPTPDRQNPPASAAYQRALKRFYPEVRPSVVGLSGWVMAEVVVGGLRAAGRDLSREKFVDALESLRDLDVGLGPNMKVNFSKTDHKAFSHGFLTVIRQGRPEPLEQFPSPERAK